MVKTFRLMAWYIAIVLTWHWVFDTSDASLVINLALSIVTAAIVGPWAYPPTAASDSEGGQG